MGGLVLNSRIGERIVIDGDIYVQLISIRGRQARLKIEAPEHICIMREKLLKKIEQNNLYIKKGGNYNE